MNGPPLVVHVPAATIPPGVRRQIRDGEDAGPGPPGIHPPAKNSGRPSPSASAATSGPSGVGPQSSLDWNPTGTPVPSGRSRNSRGSASAARTWARRKGGSSLPTIHAIPVLSSGRRNPSPPVAGWNPPCPSPARQSIP